MYGQFADVATYPMESAMHITPKSNTAIQDAAMCGSCHTIILPVYDKDGNQVTENGQPKTFVEQATFFEWKNSRFDTIPCQTCHMPKEFHGNPLNPSAPLAYKIANIEDDTFPEVPFLAPDADITMEIQRPYSRHLLLGINTFALEMFKGSAGNWDCSRRTPTCRASSPGSFPARTRRSPRAST